MRAAVAKRTHQAALSANSPKPLIPDVYATKKAKAIENYDEDGLDFVLPSDTKLALQTLRRDWESQDPALVTSFPPIFLKSQVYYLLEDKTKVDREVNELKNSGEVLQMQVPGKDPNDVFLCLTADLSSRISDRLKQLDKMPSGPTTENGVLGPLFVKMTCLRFLAKRVFGKHTESFILREHLHNMWDEYLDDPEVTDSLAIGGENIKKQPAALVDLDAEDIQDVIDPSTNAKAMGRPSVLDAASRAPKSLFVPNTTLKRSKRSVLTPEKRNPKIKYGEMEKTLIQEGWMTRRDEGSFFLSIPQFGRFLASMKKGRKHILNHLKRAKFNELMMSELESIKVIRGSELNAKFFLRDLIGSSTLLKTILPSGPLIRLSPVIHV